MSLMNYVCCSLSKLQGRRMDHLGMFFNLLRESASVIFARSHNLPEVLHSMPGPSWQESVRLSLVVTFQATSPGFFQM